MLDSAAMNRRTLAALLAACLLVAALAHAAQGSAVEADSDDVRSIDAVVDAYYESLSGNRGDDRSADKKRYQSLFAPFAHVITPTGVGDDGRGVVIARPIDDWMTRYPSRRAESFYEWEIVRRTDQFDHMASVFSTYEISRDHQYDETPDRHGVTQFTLAYMNDRWWIVALQWSGRVADQPLPQPFGR